MKNTAQTIFAVFVAIFALVGAARPGPYEGAFTAYYMFHLIFPLPRISSRFLHARKTLIHRHFSIPVASCRFRAYTDAVLVERLQRRTR
jgi:hypothetical protein